MPSRDDYIKFFQDADKDNSGAISLNELTIVLRRKGYNMSDEDIKKMFQMVDTSGDGQISLDEYLSAMGEQPAVVHGMAYMRSVFVSFDKNGDGHIDISELNEVFKEIGKNYPEEQLKSIMDQYDDDGSGSLDYEEFMKHVYGVKV